MPGWKYPVVIGKNRTCEVSKVGPAVEEGAAVYWDDEAKAFTGAADNALLFGWALQAAEAGEARISVRMRGIAAVPW